MPKDQTVGEDMNEEIGASTRCGGTPKIVLLNSKFHSI